jgi:hypothetical protein
MKQVKNDWQRVGGEGIWTEYKNIKTGESTLRNFGKLTDMPDVLNNNCDHYYELIDPKNSDVQCQKCGRGKKIVWGLQLLKDGKIIENKPL